MASPKNAFTMMELLIVVLLLSIIAGFAIPNYQKSVEKADEREAVANLRTIASGVEMFKVRDGNYPLVNWASLSAINSGLNLSLNRTNVTYTCTANAGTSYLCAAVSPDGWQIHYHTDQYDGALHCNGGGCPSCSGADCLYTGIY